MATGNGAENPGERARAVARLSTLQRLRDDALAKNRQAMLQTIEGMIASELRMLQGGRDAATAGGPSPDREKDAPASD